MDDLPKPVWIKRSRQLLQYHKELAGGAEDPFNNAERITAARIDLANRIIALAKPSQKHLLLEALPDDILWRTRADSLKNFLGPHFDKWGPQLDQSHSRQKNFAKATSKVDEMSTVSAATLPKDPAQIQSQVRQEEAAPLPVFSKSDAAKTTVQANGGTATIAAVPNQQSSQTQRQDQQGHAALLPISTDDDVGKTTPRETSIPAMSAAIHNVQQARDRDHIQQQARQQRAAALCVPAQMSSEFPGRSTPEPQPKTAVNQLIPCAQGDRDGTLRSLARPEIQELISYLDSFMTVNTTSESVAPAASQPAPPPQEDEVHQHQVKTGVQAEGVARDDVVRRYIAAKSQLSQASILWEQHCSKLTSVDIENSNAIPNEWIDYQRAKKEYREAKQAYRSDK